MVSDLIQNSPNFIICKSRSYCLAASFRKSSSSFLKTSIKHFLISFSTADTSPATTNIKHAVTQYYSHQKLSAPRITPLGNKAGKKENMNSSACVCKKEREQKCKNNALSRS